MVPLHFFRIVQHGQVVSVRLNVVSVVWLDIFEIFQWCFSELLDSRYKRDHPV